MATAKPAATPGTPTRRRTKSEASTTAPAEPKAAKAAPRRRKAAETAETEPTTTSAAAPCEPKPIGDTTTVISSLERRALVARAAYLRAASRGFAPGHEVEDWHAAEAEIDAQLGRGN